MEDVNKNKGELKVKTENAITRITELATGIASSRRHEVAGAIGRSIQGAIKDHSLAQMAEELSIFQEKGKIPEGYGESQQAWDCLNEVERAIYQEEFDSTKYEATKNMFLNVAMERFTDRNDILAIELMRVATTFSALEIKLLNDVWQIYTDGGLNAVAPNRSISRSHDWNIFVADRGVLTHVDLIEKGSRSLQKKGALNSNPDDYKSFIVRDINGSRTRLSTLGVAICELMCTKPESEDHDQ